MTRLHHRSRRETPDGTVEVRGFFAVHRMRGAGNRDEPGDVRIGHRL
jgi:hypothetical protein